MGGVPLLCATTPQSCPLFAFGENRSAKTPQSCPLFAFSENLSATTPQVPGVVCCAVCPALFAALCYCNIDV
jgi:hypothetical protein